MIQPIYPDKQIGSIRSLSLALGFKDRLLKIIASEAIKYYIENPLEKPDGGIRMTYIVKPPLKTIQDRIKGTILDKVIYPPYIHGGIVGKDYITDARLHSGKEELIHEDIKSFFPSINKNLVFRVWKYFFNFPTDVGELLTNLTTFNSTLPQGASTSTHIANLVFWDEEPSVEFELRNKGIVYSRFVDDIQVSTDRLLSTRERKETIDLIYGMFFRHNLKPNRKKHFIYMKHKSMRVHHLIVNSNNPTLPDHKKYQIWASLRNIELLVEQGEDISTLEIRKITGQINMYSRFHPHPAAKLLERLENAVERSSKI